MTRHLAVLGSPIAHSKSPALHSAAYRTLQLNWDYTRVELTANHLLQFIETLDIDWLGLSLTMPLKEEALRIANEKSPLAFATGVANTLLRTTTGWTAFNTDVFGIQRAVSAAIEGAPKRVVIVGSGATAASAVFAAHGLFSEAKITVVSRNAKTATALQKRAASNGIKIATASMRKLRAQLSRADLAISTLPAGALDESATKLPRNPFFRPAGILLDVAYDPWPSELAKAFEAKHARVITGVEMLIWQAIAQIRIFNHNDIDVDLPNERAVELAMRHSLGLI